MGQMFLEGGAWPVLILAAGLPGLGLAVSMLRSGAPKDHTSLVVGLVMATFFLGVGATALGLYEASNVMRGVAATDQPALIARAIGIASSTTAFGALLAAVDAIVLGIARARRASRCRAAL